MGSDPKSFWRRDSVQLAGLLFIAGTLAILFSMGSGTATVSQPNPATRKPMAGIAATDLNGSRWRLADQKGSVVLINVWASWCPPCREETPGLVHLAKEYAGRPFEIVGVSMDDGPEPVRRFVREFGIPYTVVMPAQDSPLTAAVESLPTSFLLDREGRVARTYMGAIDERQLRSDVDGLMAEP